MSIMKTLTLTILPILLFATVCLGQASDLCGKIPSGAITIPSYSFRVVDKNGKQFENLRVTGQLVLSERKWGNTYQDWNWEQINHITKIPIKFDSSSGLYISEEILNVPVPVRKHKWILKPKCLDKFEFLRFEFTLGEKITPTEGYQGSFMFYFENKKLSEFTLPPSADPINIEMSNWYGTKSL